MFIPELDADYKLGREIGGTHRSRVFEAADRKTGSPCIVKLVPKNLSGIVDAAALREEFDRLSQLVHPHLVRVLDFGEGREWIWSVSERIDGVPLDDPDLAADEAKVTAWAGVLLETLAFLHDRGVIHHDIKPTNVLIHRSGDPATLIVIDLGFSGRHYYREDAELRGTPGFLAPELSAPGSVDHRIDLYAAGKTLERLLPVEVSPAMKLWIDRMTRDHPEERFPHARAARAALLGLESAEAVLEPHLIRALPWARCRNAWRDLFPRLLREPGCRVALSGPPEEVRLFSSALRSSLLAQGVAVEAREAARGGTVYLGGAPGAPARPIRLAPYDRAEVGRLIGALHPGIHLERPLIGKIADATAGDPARLRSLLTRLLEERPSLERFRQKLIEALEDDSEEHRPPVRRLLRRGEFARALARLRQEDGNPELKPLRIRLLVECGRVAEAATEWAGLPPGAVRERLRDRLSFLEGRFGECRPTPEVLVRLGRHREAYRAAAEKLSRPFLAPRQRGELERVAGLAAYYTGELDTAEAHLRRSKRVWRKLKNVAGYIPAVNQLGMVLSKKGDLKGAVRHYRRACVLAERSGDRKKMVGYLLNLALARSEEGKLAEAMELFEKGRTACRLLGLAGEAAAMTQNLANLWIRLGNAERAERLLLEAEREMPLGGAADLRTYQRILEGDLLLLGKKREAFVRHVAASDFEEEKLGRFAPAVAVLKAEAMFHGGETGKAIDLLARSGDEPLHRTLLQSEWEWGRGAVDAREIEKRYRGFREGFGPSAERFLPRLARLRFLGLLARAAAGPLPADLQEEAFRIGKELRRHLPPDLWGGVRKQIREWFGEGPRAAPGDRSGTLGSIGREGREAVRVFLRIAARMTGGEGADTLMATILRELIRLSGAQRGAIVLREKEDLKPVCFQGRAWESEIDLPRELSRSVTRLCLEENRVVAYSDARAAPAGDGLGASVRSHGLRGIAALPLRAKGEPFGAVYLDDPDRPLPLDLEALELLEAVAHQAALAIETSRLLEALKSENGRTAELNRRLEEMSVRLRQRVANLEELRTPRGTGRWERFGLFGSSPSFRRALKLAERAVGNEVRVLIVGEPGTEKERLARAIALQGDRADEPFLVLDCSAVAENLFEAELFGYEAGAFTGAEKPQPGLLRRAGRGSVLLENVGYLSAASQVKLLRVLQESRIRPLGSAEEVAIEARVLATADRDPKELIGERLLREDLYYRIAAMEIVLPPLKRRIEDLPYLVRSILEEIAGRHGGPPKRITRAALRRFAQHPWPGNLAELSNELERAALAAEGDRIDLEDLSEELRTPPVPERVRLGPRTKLPRLRISIERKILLQTLEETGWNFRLAAARLGVTTPTLYRKAKRYGIDYLERR